jgi:hypothetical protein
MFQSDTGSRSGRVLEESQYLLHLRGECPGLEGRKRKSKKPRQHSDPYLPSLAEGRWEDDGLDSLFEDSVAGGSTGQDLDAAGNANLGGNWGAEYTTTTAASQPRRVQSVQTAKLSPPLKYQTMRRDENIPGLVVRWESVPKAVVSKDRQLTKPRQTTLAAQRQAKPAPGDRMHLRLRRSSMNT